MYDYENTPNLGKLYFLPEIHKKLFNIPGRSVISNCATLVEKASEFLDYHLKQVVQSSWPYIKDLGYFLRKIKPKGNLPENSIPVTTEVEGLYLSIPYELGLKALEEALEKRESKQISTDNVIKLTKFLLQNNYFEVNEEVKQRILETAIRTKFAPQHACIFMDQVECKFLKTQQHQSLRWFR